MSDLKKYKKAKKLTIKVWEWFRDNPDAEYKAELPMRLFNQVKDYLNDCPLCGLFYDDDLLKEEWETTNCTGCPLKDAEQQCDSEGENYFTSWASAGMPGEFQEEANKTRQKAAAGIVDVVKCWRIEEKI